jgi:HAD superfamily hydrolase (TIGR01509 family)
MPAASSSVHAVLFDFGNTLVAEEPGRDLLEMALVPIPFAHELITSLKRRYRLGVISNTGASGDRELLEALRQMGLLDAFGTVISSRDAGVAKPDPAIYRLAAQRLEVPLESAVMVGDRLETDIAGARAAGIPGIWLCHDPQPGRHPLAALADFTVHSLKDVPHCLHELDREPRRPPPPPK